MVYVLYERLEMLKNVKDIDKIDIFHIKVKQQTLIHFLNIKNK